MLTTLVVEDNLEFRGALKEALLACFPDMLVEGASDGREAIRIVQERAPKLVFMDINLPGERNGLTLTNMIKKMTPETTIVILTAHGSRDYFEAAAAAGATCFAVKDSLQLEHLEILVNDVRSKSARV